MLLAASIILAISIIIALARLITATTDADRVIAVDVLSFQLLGMSLLLAAFDERPLGIQFAFAVSMLGFISTLILSRLIRTA